MTKPLAGITKGTGNSLSKSTDDGKGKFKEIVEDSNQMKVHQEEILAKKEIQTAFRLSRLQKAIKATLRD
jgi:hypothetical protein